MAYYAHAAGGQLDLLQHRVPLAEAIADPSTKPQVLQKLSLASQVRAYATSTIGLPDNGSYRSYVDVQREQLLWTVFAAPEFSLRPIPHCFPLVGCVAYRGFFSAAKAKALADKFEAEGHDVYIGRATAYSSLGWFADPIVSTMLRRSDADFAELLIHELAHQQLYIDDDTVFNESFATAVASIAIEQMMAAELVTKPAAWAERHRRQSRFISLLLSTQQALRATYADATANTAELRDKKAAIFKQLRQDYAALKQTWNGYAGYDGWFSRPINNARFVAVGSYNRWTAGFTELFRRSQQDWSRFFQNAAWLGGLPASQRAALLDELSAYAEPP